MNSYNLQFHLDTRDDDFEDETSQQQQRLLLHALSALKKHELNLIELRFFEKRSFKEIGELQNITENNAKVKTFRALEKLRTLFKNKFNTQLQYSS
jgi:RNA polymerase sigma-70 factor (ECF subfamily)